MTEDVLVSVSGLHTIDTAEGEDIEVISAGRYFYRDGKHYLLYEEQVEDSGDITYNRITAKDGYLEYRRNGPVSTKMIFVPGEKTESWYNTPFGDMLLGINVTGMNIREQEDVLEINVAYGLEVNYEDIADCNIRVRAVSKGSGLFRLR